MADAAFIAALGFELATGGAAATPPIVYSAPPADWTDEAAAIADFALLTAVDRPVDVETLSASQLFEAIENADWDSRDADQKAKIQLVVSLGDSIQIAPGTKARAILAAALTGATASLNNLGALGTKNVSRAEELGFSGLKLGHIQLARRDAP